ncbi:MAG: class I SAM-dependent methyltransferase [Myxococcales bacterium]
MKKATEFGGYSLMDGIFTRGQPVVHDGEQYDTRGYAVLADMQRRHFWHRGRHRFLEAAVQRQLDVRARTRARVIDLGAGCGGWVDYLQRRELFPGGQVALGDSSPVALRAARDLVSGQVSCFQIDLLNLGFRADWDVAFLLDVVEHIDDDVAALRNAREALAPGGLLFVTVPALQSFWSWNDEVVKHKRRYSAVQLQAAAEQAGLVTLDTRYFMFLLSPLLIVSRKLKQPRLEDLDADAQWALIEKTHAVPAAPINGLLSGIFSLETPLSRMMHFPWGTSLLGVFRRPM